MIKFLRGMFHRLAETDMQMTPLAREAYDESFGPYHAWLVKKMVNGLFAWAGTREWCAEKMGSTQPKEDAAELDASICRLDDNFEAFFVKNGFNHKKADMEDK